MRRAGQPEFTEADADLLAGSSSLFARAVRRGLVAEAAQAPAPAAEPPGVLEVDASGEPTRVSSSAHALLAEISGTTAEDGVRAPAIRAIASATRAAIAAADHGAPALPSATVKTPAGTWLVLHGGLLSADSSEHAVFIQRAHPTLVAPLLLRAYGLTGREQEVTQLVLRGATTAQIAVRLAISRHTVADHLKSIFDKTGARTRGELSATLFFGEHLPRIQDRVAVGDDASFIDAPRPRGRTG